MGDLRNAVGTNPLRALPRLWQGLRALMAGIRGDERGAGCLPIRVQLEITDRCNFDCVMCNRKAVVASRSRTRNDLAVGDIERLLDRIRPAYVTLNGNGEPLLYRGLFEVLALCRERGITTAMPTNVSVLEGRRLEALLADPPDHLVCSLYGTSERTFSQTTQAPGFDRCLSNLRTLKQRYPGIFSVHIAVQSVNAGDFEETWRFLRDLDLTEHVVLLPVHDYAENNGGAATGLSAASLELVQARLVQSKAGAEDADHARFLARWAECLEDIDRARPVRETGPCLVPWISTYVDAVGDVRPCCYLSDGPHVMGNVHETSFDAIWNGTAYRDFRRRMVAGRDGLAACRACARNDAVRIRRYRALALPAPRWGREVPAPADAD